MTPIALATLAVTAPIVAQRLDDMAHQVAATIDMLDGLTPEQRCDLRLLPIEMLRLRDLLEYPPPPAEVIRPARWSRPVPDGAA